MAMLNSLFGKGKQQVGDVEFWHGHERAGWLMKQGDHKQTQLAGFDKRPKLTSICCCQASSSRHGVGGASAAALRAIVVTETAAVCDCAYSSESAHILTCRYFVLKQGKIFWFKSDVITPVSPCA